MDSDSAVSLSSSPPPSSHEYSAPAGEESPDPEEYETASDPEVDGTDTSAVAEDAFLPEENVLTNSPATEDQKKLSFDEGESHDSGKQAFLRENSDSMWNSNGVILRVGEELEEDDEKEKFSSVPQYPVGNDDSGRGNIAKRREYGAGESLEEKHENLGEENEHSNSTDTAAEGDWSVTTMIPKDGVADSTFSLAQNVLVEVEQKAFKSEPFVVVSSGEVGDAAQERYTADVERNEKSVNLNEVLPANIDTLEDKHIGRMAPEALEVEAEPCADRADKFGSLVTEVNDSKSTGAERELEVVDEAEHPPVKPLEIGAIDDVGSEESNEEVNLVKAKDFELDSVDPNDEIVGKSLVESTEIVNSEPEKGAADKVDRATNPSEIAAVEVAVGSEDTTSPCEGETISDFAKEVGVGDEITHGTTTKDLLQKSVVDNLCDIDFNETSTRSIPNLGIANEKAVVRSEHVSSPGQGEVTVLLTADGGDLNSAIEVGTVPVSAKESAVGDENSDKITTESLPQRSKAVFGTEHTSSNDEGEPALQLTAHCGDSCPAVEVEAFPVADESLSQIPIPELKAEADTGESQVNAVEEKKDEAEDEDRTISDSPARVAILDGPGAANQIIREMDGISSCSQSDLQGSHNYLTNVDGQIISDSDEVLDSDEDGDGGELFDSAALAALLKAAAGTSDGTATITAQDAARIFSGDRPVGLGASAPSLRPSAPRSARPSVFTSSEIAAVEEADRSMDDDEKRLHEKVEAIRVKFLRLVHRLGHSPADAVAGQVLYRLSLAEGIKQGRQMSRAFSIESAKKQALQLEEEGKEDLNFSCNILVLGKSGVGKSATINSIFGEERSQTNPFHLATTSVRDITGVVDGVRVRVIDTPGLKTSVMDQATNRKILSSIKRFTKKCPPDIVLYVDRMDTQTRDSNDLPLLKSITSILGSSIWFNAIVALTHAASAPPDGPNGSPLGYEMFVTQRSHVVQQSVRHAAGDMRLMNPVALVENHPSCRRNREGERVLPNGLSWRPQLLLLSYASKILSEANSLLKLQDPSPGKLFGGFRLRSPPLPFLLSSLLQSRAHPKLSGDQGGDNADSDVDIDEVSDAEQDEEVDEYDQLPPFKPLRKNQIAMLTKEQKKAYFDEYDYRVKLLQKKQWKEALRRLKETKKKGKDDIDEFSGGDMPDYDQDGSPAAVQVPLPDMVLPPSFDCDNPAFRYRFLEPTSQLLTRPVLDTHGWDHDCGYDGVSIEESLAIAGRFPTSLAVQITKDKKEFNIHLDSSVAVKHGDHGSTLAGFDIQSVGKQLAYILRGETKFDSLKKNKTAAGVSVTFLGETVSTGLKVEDRILIGKRLGLVASTGAVRAQGDVAYGANLEMRLRDKDYPIGQALSTLGLSLMKWRSDLALGANLQSQFSVGRNSKMAVRVGLNNKLTGQITVRTSTSDQLQIAFAGIIPLAIYLYRSIKSNESYMSH